MQQEIFTAFLDTALAKSMETKLIAAPDLKWTDCIMLFKSMFSVGHPLIMRRLRAKEAKMEEGEDSRAF